MPYVVAFLAFVFTITPNSGYYVTQKADEVSFYRFAFLDYGSTVLLAHENKAGASFDNLQIGDLIQVGYPDGMQLYKVSEIQKYKATDPLSVNSYFINDAGVSFGSEELGRYVYGGRELVLQTCFDDSAGRLFVFAEKTVFIPQHERNGWVKIGR